MATVSHVIPRHLAVQCTKHNTGHKRIFGVAILTVQSSQSETDSKSTGELLRWRSYVYSIQAYGKDMVMRKAKNRSLIYLIKSQHGQQYVTFWINFSFYVGEVEKKFVRPYGLRVEQTVKLIQEYFRSKRVDASNAFPSEELNTAMLTPIPPRVELLV